MLNLFKSKEPITTSVQLKDYPAIVHEIHKEFLTAGDSIIEEANSILSECEAKSICKGKRLAALGFNKVPEAVNAIETENKIITTKEVADLVRYYQINYPNNKFITEPQVKSICEKYGLLCGDISMYKGFVPERNLNQIELFKLKGADTPFATLEGSRYKADGFDTTIHDETIGYLNESDIIDKWAKGQIINKGHFWVCGRSIDSSSKDKVNNRITNLYDSNWGYVKAVPFDKSYRICAPLKDMDIPSDKRVDGYKIKNIPDPVVLQPVNGGYLIVTAWGDEASDEIIVNEKMN
jgi:hypothetical protein